MAKIDGVQEVSLDLLKPYENNAKVHSEEQVQKIADSIKEFGFLNPCLIDKDYNIIAGHGRVLASLKLGLTQVPCVFVEGLTDAQRRAYILADNKLTEMGDWNNELVSEELEKLKTEGFNIDLTGFSIDDIIFTEEDDADEELEEEPQKSDPRIHYGEVWELGKHRLMCGDSTKEEDVKKLMDGKAADLLLTDPPYNVDLGGVNKAKAKIRFNSERYKGANTDSIENDNMEKDQFVEFLTKAFINANNSIKEGAPFYIWYGTSSVKEFLEAADNADLPVHQHLIWVKNQLVLGLSDYQWRHEPCLYGWKKGAGHYFIDLRSQDTVLGTKNIDNMSLQELREAYKELTAKTSAIIENKPQKNKEHPTMKPVGLMKKLVRNSSKEGDTVLDLFGGSGTTLIACEEMNRKCLMMEYDPEYAEKIISRWEQLTGEQAVLVNG